MSGKDPAALDGVGRQVAVGAAFMIAARLAVRGLSVIALLVTARLLAPEDFGLVVLAAAVIGLTELLAVTGYGQVLVRHPSASRQLYDTAWTLNLGRCLLLAGLVAGTAEWQAGLVGDQRIAAILQVSALAIMLDGLASIGMHRLDRDLAFDRVFRFQVVTRFTAFAVSILLALILGNYWCLILGTLTAKAVAVPYSYWLAPHRPRLSLRHWRELLHFSKWMVVISLCNTAQSHGISLLLGRIVGLPALGSYHVSYNLAALPVHEIAVPIRQPIYAGYAKVQHDLALLRRHFLEGFAYLATAMVPLSVGIALTAPQVSHLALGPGWGHAVPLIALCALFSLADCLAAFGTNVFFVLDRLAVYVKTLVALTLLRLPAVAAAAALSGIEAVVAVMVGTAVLNAVIWHRLVARLLGHSLHDTWAAIHRSAIASLVMSAVVLGLQAVLPAGPPAFAEILLELGLLVSAGAVAHVGTQLLLWRLSGAPDGPERRLLSLGRRLVDAAKQRLTSRLGAWQ
jgi:PST family polysaccharide transporter